MPQDTPMLPDYLASELRIVAAGRIVLARATAPADPDAVPEVDEVPGLTALEAERAVKWARQAIMFRIERGVPVPGYRVVRGVRR